VIKSVLLSGIVHVLALFALIFSFDWNLDEELEPVNIIQATAVDESKISKQIEKLKKIEARKKRDEDQRLAKLAEEAQQARRDRERQQQKLIDLQKKHEQEKKMAQQLKQDRVKAESKLKQQEKQFEDQKFQEDIAQQLREYDMARIRADKAREAKRDHKIRPGGQDVNDIQKQLEAELAARVAAEKNQKTIINDPNAEVVATEIQLFQAQLVKLVGDNWIKPPGMSLEQAKGLKCVVNVRLMPTGDVSYVKIVEGCGDSRYQRSVEAAVKKAAPYPIPENKDIFDRIREINFNFSPSQES